MEFKKNKISKWFTVVELVVVITILSILWSIAFVAIWWYQMNARNSKRSFDLSSISKEVEMLNINWTNLINAIKNNSSTIQTNIQAKP